MKLRNIVDQARPGEGVPTGSTAFDPQPTSQRASLNLNVHFHTVALDGVYTRSSLMAPPVFHQVGALPVDVAVPAGDPTGRAQPCRYAARPSFADEQLSKTEDGRIAFALRKPRRNGTTHLFFKPEQLLRRLAWLIPPPRQHLVRYQGVLGPASTWRADIVPARSCLGLT